MNAQSWATELSDAIGRVALRILEFLPAIFGALALLLIGWLIAVLLRTLLTKLSETVLTRLSRQRFASTKAVQSATRQSRTWQSTPAIVGGIVFWTVLLFFIAAAVEALGLSAVSNIVGLVTAYLPQVLAGVLILLVGLWAGEFAYLLLSRATAKAQLAYGDVLARFAQALIVLVMAIIAIDHLGVQSAVLVTILAIVFAATFGAAALAFGLGARDAVSNILASRYLRRAYSPGDVVRIGEHQGTIIEITETAVMLDTEGGRVLVPACHFNEQTSVLVTPGNPE
ncbi:MAG: mechanosensitive ion channel [Gammaproteobacteria bacterium]|nr:mechanosensitive ion channel [Gammaproteobacteria bacterium]